MKITINLLPPEIKAEELKKTKFYLIQAVGVVVILIMIFLASLTVSLRVLQNKNIDSYKVKMATAEQRVTDLKETQASVLLIKDRMAVINQYFGIPSKPSAIYGLMDRIIPSTAVVNAFNVDQVGGISLSVYVSDLETLDRLLNNLTLKENNDGMISQVSIENLNRGKDNLYRIAFKIKSK